MTHILLQFIELTIAQQCFVNIHVNALFSSVCVAVT